MKKSVPRSRRRPGFSLIEVVLAIGVVAFALVGIFGLFSASLRTNKDASAQQESFQVQRMILSRMLDTNVFSLTVLSNMFNRNYLVGGVGGTNYLFVYTSNPPGNAAPLTILQTNISPTFSVTNGTLYFVLLKRTSSNNMPTNIFSRSGGGGGSYVASDWNNWPSYPAHADVYAIPTSTMTNVNFLNRSAPVVSFEFIIPK